LLLLIIILAQYQEAQQEKYLTRNYNIVRFHHRPRSFIQRYFAS